MARKKKATSSQSTLEKLAAAIGACGKSAACCSGMIEADDFEITIADAGLLPLPMRAKHVRELGDIAKPAPYGKRTETIVDAAVRNSLEIDSAKVQLSAALQRAIDDQLPVIERGLGLPPGRLKAELYKLLIYPTGGRFRKHRDSEKRKGMVGSLIVVLPSKFKRGSLLVWEKDRPRRFDFGQARLEQTAEYVAFYADCEHEVERVESGVRVCLAFNLIVKPSGKRKRKPSDAADPVVVDALSDRLAAHPQKPIVFPLDHHYTAAGLKPNLLKGADREIAEQVRLASEQLGCRLYFGQVSRHLCQYADDGSFGYERRGYRSGPVDYDNLNIGESYNDEIVIDGWKDASGKNVSLAELPCDETMLACTTPVEQWKPTRQDYEGYTGNAGNTLDRWYHQSAVVIWSNEHHAQIVVQMGIEYAIEQLLSKRGELQSVPDDDLESACDECQSLAEAIIDKWPERLWRHARGEKEDQKELKKFADELPSFDDPDLIGRFLQSLAGRDWTFNLDKLVVQSCCRMGADVMLPILQSCLSSPPPTNQYGRIAAEGLADRDASWIQKLATDKKHAGLATADLAGLIEIATARLIAYVEKLEHGSYHRSFEDVQAPWKRLFQAAIVIRDDDTLAKLFDLLRRAPTCFPIRTFQVAAANEIDCFSNKLGGEISATLRGWIHELNEFLTAATNCEPTPPQDFSRPNQTDCDCRFCLEMQTFLVSPTQETTRIAAREDRRHHLVDVIRSKKLDVTTAVEKTSSPHKLVLRKTSGSFDRALKQYHNDLKLHASLPKIEG
ncbi:hypothetical protein Poly51_38820 [Rubripirellula tenax]|uniref:Uncharacterized protein n=1 Tax=Rubripirellula tenax TaxID=2528015 RepID=A0A5C6EQN0_9BACT|nr:2OG-Fe(II) oxygenase [Rubripirellula tenax]TWU50590.1 hypothetical protein Poly51_38820 [Rubripirellula tenax]